MMTDLGFVPVLQSVLIWILFLSQTSGDTSLPSHSEIAEFETFAERVRICRNVPAMTLSLVKNNTVVLAKGFGFADRERGVRATAKTRFCIGSLTKAFTSTLVAKLLGEQDRFTWDSPLKDILGEDFRLSDPLRTEETTIRDLLAHKVGVPGYFAALQAAFPSDVSRAELVRRLRYMTTDQPFRTKFIYNNFMFNLAGHVAERLGNASWEELTKRHLLDPLRMTSSGFIDDQSQPDNFAKPYVSKGGRLSRVPDNITLTVHPAGPAGSIYSTSEDMVRWLMFHLNMGTIPGTTQRLIDPEILHETYVDSMAMQGYMSAYSLNKHDFPVSDAHIGYGLGWTRGIYRGYEYLWHSGGISTYSSLIWLIPGHAAGIYMTISGPLDRNKRPAIRTIMYRAAEMLLGIQPWLNTSTACTFPEPWIREQTRTIVRNTKSATQRYAIDAPAHAYTGTFGHLAFGNITIVMSGDILILKFGQLMELKLCPQEKRHVFAGHYSGSLWFLSEADDPQDPMMIEFQEDENGKINKLMFPMDHTANVPFIRGKQLMDIVEESGENMDCFCVSHGVKIQIEQFILFLFILLITMLES